MAKEANGIALVTGAGSGVGKDIAITLAARDVEHVFCADINIVAAAAVASEINKLPGTSVATELYIDVSKEESVVAAFKKVRELSRTKRIDYFVNAAGSGPTELGSITDMSLSQYRSMDEEHNIGSFLTLREALRTMSHQEESDITLPVGGTFNRSNRGISRGTIVMVASLSSKGGAQGAAHYVAAKHAVEGLVQTAALENARSGIRVNAVSPSYINDKMMQKQMRKKPGLEQVLLEDLPLGRLVDPGEVSDAIVFLLSAASSYLNGANMVIDGGVTGMLGRPRYHQ